MSAWSQSSARCTILRWLKFNAVGGMGVAVQLGTLAVLKSALHSGYLVATAIAVEAAVVHNFVWHERFTWSDRVRPHWKDSATRLLKFNFSTGMVSILGNLAMMKTLVGLGQLDYLVANGVTIACCSVLNFLISDRVVFEQPVSAVAGDLESASKRPRLSDAASRRQSPWSCSAIWR